MEVVLFGGEPLLRRDAIPLVAYARSRGMLPHIFTNGILLDEERTRALKEAGLFRVNISLDSPDAEEHDSRRRLEGCFEKAVAGIERIVALGIRCIVWTYASKKDVAENDMRDLRGMIALSKKLGVNGVYVCFPVPTGNWACGQHEMLSLEERERVRVFQSDPFVELEFPEETSPCRGGIRMLYVYPDGRLTPCPCIPHVYGDVHDEPLDVIARRMWKDMMRYKREAGGMCIMEHPEFRQIVYGDEGPPGAGVPCATDPAQQSPDEESD
jgi:MoaA/NifB/PqqE/SkfB family radical SAM enzyme